MLSSRYDRWIFGACLLGAFAAWIMLFAFRTSHSRPLAKLRLGPDFKIAVGETTFPATLREWPGAEKADEESEWRYDLFTPPEICYDEEQREFAVVGLAARPAKVPGESRVGVSLVEIIGGLFRVQLVGYIGEAQSGQGIFEDVETGDTYLAGIGQEIPGLEITVNELIEASSSALKATDNPARPAEAVVHDARRDRSMRLTANARVADDPLVAVLADGSSGVRYSVRDGETVTISGKNYRAVRIDAAKGEAEFDVTLPTEGAPTSTRTVLSVVRSDPAAMAQTTS